MNLEHDINLSTLVADETSWESGLASLLPIRSWQVFLDEISIYTWVHDKDAAVEQALDLALDYAQDYLDRLEVSLNVPDRRGHYPYLLRLAHAGSRDEARKVLGL